MKVFELIEILKRADFCDYVTVCEENANDYKMTELFSSSLEDNNVGSKLLEREVIKTYIGEDELIILIK